MTEQITATITDSKGRTLPLFSEEELEQLSQEENDLQQMIMEWDKTILKLRNNLRKAKISRAALEQRLQELYKRSS